MKERSAYKLGSRASFKVLPILKEFLNDINEVPNGEFSSLCNVAIYNHFLFQNLDERIRKMIKEEIDKIKKE